ncbi:MAG: hypothetical protein ACLUUO_16645 [Sellimonas intestinalis]
MQKGYGVHECKAGHCHIRMATQEIGGMIEMIGDADRKGSCV